MKNLNKIKGLMYFRIITFVVAIGCASMIGNYWTIAFVISLMWSNNALQQEAALIKDQEK